jgi:serine/threonine-protein kinase RsbW
VAKGNIDEAGGSDDRPLVINRQKFTLRFRRLLPSTKAALNDAVRDVLEVIGDVACPPDDKADLEIALREALANAVIHGNKNAPDKQVLLRAYAEPEGGVLVAVRDEGEGFDPGDVPDPRSAERIFLAHGRGIFLMRELMDHVEHRKGGREVVLFKSCDSEGHEDDPTE